MTVVFAEEKEKSRETCRYTLLLYNIVSTQLLYMEMCIEIMVENSFPLAMETT